MRVGGSLLPLQFYSRILQIATAIHSLMGLQLETQNSYFA